MRRHSCALLLLLLVAVLHSADCLVVYQQPVKGRLVCSNGFGGPAQYPISNRRANVSCVFTAVYKSPQGRGRIFTSRTRVEVSSDANGFFSHTLTFTDRAPGQQRSPTLSLQCTISPGHRGFRRRVVVNPVGVTVMGNMPTCRRFYKPVMGRFACAESVPPRPIPNFRGMVACTLSLNYYYKGDAGPKGRMFEPVNIPVTSNATGFFMSRLSQVLPLGIYVNTNITDARLTCYVDGPSGTMIPSLSKTAYAIGPRDVDFKTIPVMDRSRQFCP